MKNILNTQKFSDRLKLALNLKDISQKKLADFLGEDPRKINGWTRPNKGTPSPEIIGKIAKYLKVSTDWLLDGSGEMTLIDAIFNTVSENEHFYGGRVSIPIVGKISNDKYDPGDVISQVMYDRNEVNPSFFFLYMFEEKLVTKGNKIIWKGDLLLINPNIKDIYPGDLVAVLSRSGRQWVRYVENWDRITLQLQGGIKLNSDEIAGMYRIVKVRPAEFEV